MRQDKYDYTLEGSPPSPDQTVRYYSQNQIYIGTFLGGPIAAIWYMARNFSAFRQEEAVRVTWLYGILSTLVFLEVALFVPDEVPSVAFSAFYTGVTAFLLEKYQKSQLAELAADNMSRAESGWKVAGVAIVSMIAVLVLAIVLVALTEIIAPGSIPGLEEVTGTP